MGKHSTRLESETGKNTDLSSENSICSRTVQRANMSKAQDEVLSIRRKLEKMTENGDQDQAMDLLSRLRDIDMNLSILTNTRIGMTVNALRKSSSDSEVISQAKSLIKAWKKFVPENADRKEAKDHTNGKSDKIHHTEKKSSSSDRPIVQQRASATADDVRLGCRRLLASALTGDGELPEGIVKTTEELAELIEETIFRNYKSTNPKYKNQVRSRVFNLKDKKNPSLRENVLCGVIAPERMAIMTSEEMASDEVKKQREAFIKEGIDSAQLAQVEGTKCSDMKCGKCGKRNCTYNQLQTRSADEPMTTFVMCNECGNRWKF